MRKAFAQVIAPLLSVNEPEAQVVDLFVTAGSKVAVGDRLCTLETTKATFEVEAEVEGYIHDVLVAKGQQVTAGAVLFEISAEPLTEPSPGPSASSAPASEAEPRPEGLLISKKGLRLAKELGVALDALPLDVLVTEAMVRSFLQRRLRRLLQARRNAFPKSKPRLTPMSFSFTVLAATPRRSLT